MFYTYKLSLETITPVSIGSGDKLSPYSDFVLDERKIYYVNQNEIKKALASKPALMDEYVNSIVSEMDNTRSNFDLNHFLTKRLGVDIKRTAILVIPAEARVIKQLSTIIKNAGIHPYIPGSSVKGAIKTALLYNWMIEHKDGKKWLRDFMQGFSDYEKRKAGEKMLDNKFDEFELGVSDSSLFDVAAMKVYETQRLHLKDSNKKGIPQTLEAIDAEHKTTLTLTSKISLDEIFDAACRHSKDCNNEMWAMLDEIGKNVDDNTYNKLSGYYKSIGNQLNKGAVLLRLGFGKGYFFNSVGLAVAYYEKGKYFGDFLKMYGHKKFKNVDEFPVTQVITAFGKQPLGWVKMEEQK